MLQNRKILILCLLCFFLCLISYDAQADVFGKFSTRALNFAVGLRGFAFVLSGFGIIMFTWMAIFGKINFKHLGYIYICLFMLSGVGLLINYIVGGQATKHLGGAGKGLLVRSVDKAGLGEIHHNSSF
jgi:hypothetical protein